MSLTNFFKVSRTRRQFQSPVVFFLWLSRDYYILSMLGCLAHVFLELEANLYLMTEDEFCKMYLAKILTIHVNVFIMF